MTKILLFITVLVMVLLAGMVIYVSYHETRQTQGQEENTEFEGVSEDETQSSYI